MRHDLPLGFQSRTGFGSDGGGGKIRAPRAARSRNTERARPLQMDNNALPLLHLSLTTTAAAVFGALLSKNSAPNESLHAERGVVRTVFDAKFKYAH